VLVDLDRHEPIGLVASRKQKEIREVLEGWGSAVFERIVEVSIDLSGNYKSLVEKVLPNAVAVADRFHVMQLVNKELNQGYFILNIETKSSRLTVSLCLSHISKALRPIEIQYKVSD
jgi:transposase